MALSYTEEQKQAVEDELRAGRDIGQVAETTGIPHAVVRGWARDSGLAPRRQRPAGSGRKSVLDETGAVILRELLEANSRMTLDELIAAFAARVGRTVSRPAISKAVKSLGYRKVRLQKAPSKPAPQSPPRYTDQHRREPTATTYPSSLTDREWQALEPFFVKKERRGRPSKLDKRALVDAVFYQVRTGNQWRYLPKDFPPWGAVWSFFRRLRDSGQLDRMYDAVHEVWRQAAGRAEAPTAGIVDSQTVKTTEKGGSAATTPARKRKGASGTWSSISRGFPAQS